MQYHKRFFPAYVLELSPILLSTISSPACIISCLYYLWSTLMLLPIVLISVHHDLWVRVARYRNRFSPSCLDSFYHIFCHQPSFPPPTELPSYCDSMPIFGNHNCEHPILHRNHPSYHELALCTLLSNQL